MASVHWSQNECNYQRSLGDSEFAFFPASQNGLGDMFLHLAFRAPRDALRKERVCIAWAIIRSRHPLLVSKVVVDGGDLNTAHFSFTPPGSLKDALDEADFALQFTTDSKDELIFQYMNGSRMISNDHLSRLFICTHAPSRQQTEDDEYDLLMCAPHFTGDGTSLHQSTHELLSLLASSSSDEELAREVNVTLDWGKALPPAFETRLSPPSSTFAKAASKVNFLKTLEKEIGGHTFPRTQRGPQRTVLFERAFTAEQTVTILARCKSNSVTINHALSVLCNVAWYRCRPKSQSTELPMMMYTAMNLRSHLAPHPASTYWFLALTYFNIILPSFLPTSPAAFWLRARGVKAQTRRVVQSRFLVARALEMAGTRAARARGLPPAASASLYPADYAPSLPAPPSSALLGLSLIGNLDTIYKRTSYPSFELHSVATASRQKAGGILLLEHTFGGKLWLNLCWDENGFEEGLVERFWEGVQAAVEEYLT